MLSAMGRCSAASTGIAKPEAGRCVVCGVAGSSPNDFICADCGDPLAVTMFCRGCRRRLALDPDTARAFLAGHGHAFDSMQGLVLKVDRCGACMADDDVVDLAIYRIRL